MGWVNIWRTDEQCGQVGREHWVTAGRMREMGTGVEMGAAVGRWGHGGESEGTWWTA